MARASHIDARAIYCLQAAGGVSVLCLEVFLDPGDGTLGILSEVDVLFALGRQQRDAQAVGVGLHLVVIGANLRSQDDDVVLVHDGVVAPAAPAPAVPAIAFIGYQNSGKTTLVEKVIAELTRRGLRVGSLKHHGHHGFDIDVPAKDTWRHHQAGSKHVGLICATRWAEYADTREEDEMPARELLSRYNDVDVVIIEGYKTEGFDNIVVARSGVDRLRGKSSLDLVDGHTLALACNEALARQAFDAGFATRAININDARAICDLIQDHLA